VQKNVQTTVQKHVCRVVTFALPDGKQGHPSSRPAVPIRPYPDRRHQLQVRPHPRSGDRLRTRYRSVDPGVEVPIPDGRWDDRAAELAQAPAATRSAAAPRRAAAVRRRGLAGEGL
jgi:hypothetical protein